MHVRQSALDAVVVVRQPFVIDAEQIQDSRMKIVPVNPVLNRLRPIAGSLVLKRAFQTWSSILVCLEAVSGQPPHIDSARSPHSAVTGFSGRSPRVLLTVPRRSRQPAEGKSIRTYVIEVRVTHF